jgi:hypothetical protein
MLLEHWHPIQVAGGDAHDVYEFDDMVSSLSGQTRYIIIDGSILSLDYRISFHYLSYPLSAYRRYNIAAPISTALKDAEDFVPALVVADGAALPVDDGVLEGVLEGVWLGVASSGIDKNPAGSVLETLANTHLASYSDGLTALVPVLFW